MKRKTQKSEDNKTKINKEKTVLNFNFNQRRECKRMNYTKQT